jgi:PKD repeat protein
MLNKFLPKALTAGLLLLSTVAGAQQRQGTNPGWCGTALEQERYFAEHPGSREAYEASMKQLAALAQSQAQQRTAYVTDVTIPVVVHIIHGGGNDNISDRQINSAINQLNEDYQKLNADTASIVAQFRPIAASVGFRFRLARKDPNGNCTNGITRHYLPNLLNDPQNGAVQAVGVWDQARYMNIWVVNTIGTPSTGGGFTVGYVSPPNSPSNPRDGFVVRQDFFGNQGTSNPGNATLRGATHEIGHYFGLSHPWGATNNPGTGDCSGSDNVADTPPTDGTFNCNLGYSPCGQLANVQNFMDYASCANMFTQGQRALMRTILNANRTVLVSQANLVATGTNDGYVSPDCGPVASFSLAAGSSASICVGSSVTLRDYSYNFTSGAGALTYTWTFSGGTTNPAPITTNTPTVTVTFPNAGFYTVTETVSNSAGTSTSTQTNLIRVEGPGTGETAPLAQSFEDANFPNLFAAPTFRNYETTGTTSAGVASNSFRWQRQTAVPAANGAAYLTVADRVYPAGTITTLITPNINLAGVPQAAVRFARAYAPRSVSSDDVLRVSFSNDCGRTWTAPAVFNPAALSTQGSTPIDGFVPASSADWQDLVVAIPAALQGSGLFKIRFQMVNGTVQGNNFFFDNLRISSGLATKADALASRGISLYPNPLTSETAVHLNLASTTTVQVSLTDVLGREIVRLPAKAYAAGQQTLSLQPATHALRAGVYVVRITLNGETLSTKLSVE